jgi:hypothetical protein
MHFATKCLQTMLRCIRLISRKAALSHHCHQTSGVNNTPGEADSCKVVISLRNPWVFMTTPQLVILLGFGTYSTRVYVHSLLGSSLYGAFLAKLLIVRTKVSQAGHCQ